MAKYMHYDLNQTKMIPLAYADQIIEGSFAYALGEIVENHLICRPSRPGNAMTIRGFMRTTPSCSSRILYGYYKGSSQVAHSLRPADAT